MKKVFFLLIALLPLITAFGQDPATTDSLKAKDVLPVKKRPYFWAETSFGALTNSTSTSSIAKLAFSDFLDQEDKKELVAPVGSQLRYGFTREFSIGYRQPSYKVFDTYNMGQGFSIRNTYFNSASMSRDMVNLVMFGNKPYAGESLSLDGSAYETWYYSSLDYHFDVLFDSVQLISFTVSLQVGHDHQHIQATKGQLYTEPQGAYLDLDLDYQLQNNTINTHPLAGFGLGIGANTVFALSEKGKLLVEVRDLGIMNWNQGQLLKTDTNFRFRGLQFDNVFAINDSLTSYTDGRYTESFLYEEEDSYLVMLPFYASIAYHHKLEGNFFKNLAVQADYRYLTGFYPRLSLATEMRTGHKQRLLASVSTGGYTWFSLNAGYSLSFARYWSLRAEIKNLNGIILPGVFGGAIGTLHLRYEL